MFVCVVDDELAPRMKPNAAGEPSKFSFKYGISPFTLFSPITADIHGYSQPQPNNAVSVKA